MYIAKKCAKAFVLSLFFTALMTPQSFAAGAKPSASAETPIYVDFKYIVVPIIRENGRTGMVAINLMAQVKDEQAQSIVNMHLPRLRDAFIRSLYGTMEDKTFMAENGNLNVDRIKHRLMHTANLVLKDKNKPIEDILFQNITQQRY